jgi:hypothetical protein
MSRVINTPDKAFLEFLKMTRIESVEQVGVVSNPLANHYLAAINSNSVIPKETLISAPPISLGNTSEKPLLPLETPHVAPITPSKGGITP